MADICMCQFADCPKSNQCYRFLAEPDNKYQSYALFQNICFEKNNYRWFWQDRSKNIVTNKEKEEKAKENDK